MEERKYLKIYEVAMLVDVSHRTLEIWYMWKRKHPEHELAKLLPDFIQNGGRQIRYWKEEDIPKLKEFKTKVPKGRAGLFGEITQKRKVDKNDD